MMEARKELEHRALVVDTTTSSASQDMTRELERRMTWAKSMLLLYPHYATAMPLVRNILLVGGNLVFWISMVSES
jgi:hypothetical protein